VRITAQLIDGKSDEHLWAERWDRDLDDIFALQDEISEAIVSALKVKLLPEEKMAIETRGTSNLEAFETYLMARQYYLTGNMTDTRRSDIVIRLARRAIELDPGYARAWAMLAVAQRMQAYSGTHDDNGLAAAERALALDASMVDAYGVKIGALISARAYEEARAAIDVALALDPDSYEVHKEAGRLAFMEHRFAEAVRHYEKSSALVEADFSATGLLMSCYAALGDKVGARSAAERTLARTEPIVASEPDNGSALSMGIGALAFLGQAERAKEWTRRAILLDPDNLNMRYNIACAMILDLGEFEAGLDLLEPVLAQFGKDRLAHAKSDPDFDAVRDHPRFKAMIAAAEARLAGA
jgi:adenylate cyclase